LQDQAVQYVLGELPAAEARALETRMTSDLELASEVRRLRATLGLLPFATTAEPPPALRAQVLEAAVAQHRARRGISAVPAQSGRVVSSGASSRPPSRRRSRSRSASTRTAPGRS
jgi:anti-sigma-K factor RskA